jgi:hypothetical protein
MIKKFDIKISIYLILFITFFSFYPSLENGFTNWDDVCQVIENKLITHLSLENIKIIFTSIYFTFYHPLTLLSFAIEYHFFQLNPFIYHATNLTLHLLNSLLLFWLIYTMNEDILSSFIVSILFAIHPVHVESVAWISERKDVLSTFFFLGAIISYLYFLKKGHIKYYYLAIILFFLSLLSKPTTATLPCLLILFDYNLKGKAFIKLLPSKIPFFLMSFLAIMVNMHASVAYPIRQINVMSYDRFFYASYNLFYYLYKTVYPVKLALIYPYPEKIKNLLPGSVIISFFALLLLMLIICLSVRYTKKIFFAAGFFLITILPIILFLPFNRMVQDHYNYIPSIGLFYVAAEFISWLYIKKFYSSPLKRNFLLIICVTIIMIFSYLTRERCKVWKDSITLWNAQIKVYGNNISYYSRGCAYFEMEEYDRAIDDYTRAADFFRDSIYYLYRGDCYSKKGDYEKAIADYTEALNINDFDSNSQILLLYRFGSQSTLINEKAARTYNNRGNAYNKRGAYDKAIEDFNRALEIKPDYPNAYSNRALSYFMKREYNRAWNDVMKMKELGCKVDGEFLEKIRKARGVKE